MLKMVDGTGIIGLDMVCPLGISTPQPPNYDRVELEGAGVLVLPNSLDAPLERLELGGKTEQVQTSGKNLFDYRNTVVGLLNFTDGSFSGTYHKYLTTDYIEIEIGDYIISHNSMVVIQSYALYDINNKTYVSGKAGNNKVNIVEKCFIRISFKTKPETDVSSNPIDYAKKCNIQLEKGTTATPYEPYTGGKPAPSPEYPQEIKNVGKWNKEKQKYEVDVKITGKNLLNLQKEPDVKGIYQGWKCGNGEKITLSITDKNNNADISGCILGLSKNGDSANGGVVWAIENGAIKNKELTLTHPYVSVFPANEITIKKLTERFEIQCEYGSIATDYEPYKEQTLTLTSDRPITKWDRLVEKGGEIGWLYGTEKYVVTGQEEFITNKSYALEESVDFSFINSNQAGIRNATDNFCNKLTFVDAVWSKNDIGFGVSGSEVHIRLSLDTIGATKTDESEIIKNKFTEYLSKKYSDGEPFEFWHKSKTQEFVPLPQSEQNAIRALKTYYPTTVITADGGELDPDIKVTYRKEI